MYSVIPVSSYQCFTTAVTTCLSASILQVCDLHIVMVMRMIRSYVTTAVKSQLLQQIHKHFVNCQLFGIRSHAVCFVLHQAG